VSEADTDIVSPALVPFLKWAGGKRWLTNRYSRLLPKEFETYIEPFLGSAAVFFHLRPERAILADKNLELINVYRQIRQNWRKVHMALRRHQSLHDKVYYYKERGRQHRAAHERAAQFLYLNRTCWNGLYRVNMRGEFNVPIGTKSAVLMDTDDFAATAAVLRQARLKVCDFEATLAQASAGDFAFIDPPYITRHNFNGFVKYNEEIFSWKDQERLASSVKDAAGRGAKLLVTNAAHESIHELYGGIGVHLELNRASILAADSSNRGVTTEIAILINYRPQIALGAGRSS
jgi:DNA adenine methylase